MVTNKPSKLVKLTAYIGYDAPGTAKSDKIRAYAKSRNKSISTLLIDALKLAYPDLKI